MFVRDYLTVLQTVCSCTCPQQVLYPRFLPVYAQDMPSTNTHKTNNTDQRMRRESEPERMGHRPPDSVAWFLVQFCFVELTVLCGWRTCFFMNIDKFMNIS